MNKMAKTAIVCVILFIVSTLASAAFFVAARSEYPKHIEKFNEYFESWEPCFPDYIDGTIFIGGTDERYEIYADENGLSIREKEDDSAESSALEGEEPGNTVSSEAAAE